MFKDYNKYLKASLKVYLFVLVIIFILKIVGLDYFGIDKNNPILVEVDKLFENRYLLDFYYLLTLTFYTYVVISISCNSINSFKYTLLTLPISYLVQNSKYWFGLSNVSIIIDFIYLFLLCVIYNKIYKTVSYKKLTKRFIIYNIISFLIQLISYITRYKYKIDYEYGFIINFILNFDYMILTVIIYKISFMKGVDSICTSQMEVGSYSQKKQNLKKSLQNLQRSFHSNLSKFKKQSKEEKLTIIFYLIFSFVWNTLSVLLILFFARINDSFVECIFILTSFWLSKSKFGKAFHFNNMTVCFIISNFTYFILNRITTPLGISIFVPILLGVGLSYLTSKFVKKNYKPLYRGMPYDVFLETILKVVDKDSQKFNICKEFYIDNVSDLSLSFKYNYSVAGIRKIKERINDKIKELN